MSDIRDAYTELGMDMERFLADPRLAIIATRHKVMRPRLNLVDAEAAPALARVNHGRWIVDCPCNGAMDVWLDTPWLWCSSCANVDLAGALRPVTIPDALHRQRIEEALSHRPVINQNWQTGELIGRLRNENVAHNLPRLAPSS